MARVVATSLYRLDMRPIDGREDQGEVIYADDREVRLKDSNTVEVFRGEGFQYDDNGDVISGIVFQYSVFVSNFLVLDVTSYSGVSAPFVYRTIIDGRYGDLFSKVLEGDDTIFGSSLDDYLWGYSGNDTFFGYGGNDTINGGPGLDISVYSGVRNEYDISRVGDQILVSDRVFGRDGQDTLVSVERLKFDDGILAFDVFGTAGQVYRLYQAALARTPDLGGLSYWIGMIENHGASMRDIGYAMLMSNEFAQKYGSPSQAENFINALYRNILDRDPDAPGFSYWMETINNGADILDVLWVFSESQENINKTMPMMENGIWLI